MSAETPGFLRADPEIYAPVSELQIVKPELYEKILGKVLHIDNPAIELGSD